MPWEFIVQSISDAESFGSFAEEISHPVIEEVAINEAYELVNKRISKFLKKELFDNVV